MRSWSVDKLLLLVTKQVLVAATPIMLNPICGCSVISYIGFLPPIILPVHLFWGAFNVVLLVAIYVASFPGIASNPS